MPAQGAAPRKRRKGGRVVRTVMPADPKLNIPKIGPAPTAPRPTIKPQMGIKKQRQRLRKAREEGKAAATGQLNAIDRNVGRKINKQRSQYAKSARRIRGAMDRTVQQQRAAGRRQVEQAENRQTQLIGQRGVRGADAMIMGSAIRQAKAGARYGTQSAKAMREQGRSMAKAGRSSLVRMGNIEERQGRYAMSILDVLDAERASEDERFLQEQVFQLKMARLEQKHAIQMAEYGFEQEQYMARLQNQLEMEYTQWQLDNDLLLTPEQQAALDWKYERKSLLLSNRMTKQAEEAELGRPLVTSQVDAISNGIDTAIAVHGDEKLRAQYRESADLQQNYASVDDYLIDVARTRAAAELPEGVDPSGMNSAIEETYHRAVDIHNNGQTADGGQYAPIGWERVKELVGSADPTGVATGWMNKHDGLLQRYQKDYTAMRTATRFADERGQVVRDAAAGVNIDEELAASTSAIGGTAAAGKVIQRGTQVAKGINPEAWKQASKAERAGRTVAGIAKGLATDQSEAILKAKAMKGGGSATKAANLIRAARATEGVKRGLSTWSALKGKLSPFAARAAKAASRGGNMFMPDVNYDSESGELTMGGMTLAYAEGKEPTMRKMIMDSDNEEIKSTVRLLEAVAVNVQAGHHDRDYFEKLVSANLSDDDQLAIQPLLDGMRESF